MAYILIYLIIPRVSALQNPLLFDPSTQIFRGGTYFEASDEAQLRRIVETIPQLRRPGSSLTDQSGGLDLETLAGLSRDNIRNIFPFSWLEDEVYDILNPFGDDRDLDVETLWTLDFQNNIVQHVNRKGRHSFPLSALLERSSKASLADFQPMGAAVPPFTRPSISEVYPVDESYWKPSINVQPRIRALTHRIFRDFDFKWRHVLRAEYNGVTRRILAQALLQISTLSFEVREETGSRHGIGRTFVPIRTMPAWDSLNKNIMRLGNVHIMICESLREGYWMAQQHAKDYASRRALDRTEQDLYSMHPDLRYVLLSVKAITLCRINDRDRLECTAPEPLLNGDSETGAPSALALDYLLWATAAARRTIQTRIQRLPIELQDSILDHAAVGSVAAAHIGSILEIGSPFLWKIGPSPLELGYCYRNRGPWSSVESQIWFGNHISGVVYIKGDVDETE